MSKIEEVDFSVAKPVKKVKESTVFDPNMKSFKVHFCKFSKEEFAKEKDPSKRVEMMRSCSSKVVRAKDKAEAVKVSGEKNVIRVFEKR